MRTVIALSLTLTLASTGCASRTASRRTALVLGAVAIGALAYGASQTINNADCSNSFPGPDEMDTCGQTPVAAFSIGIGFGLAAAVTWAHGDQETEGNDVLVNKGRLQRTHLLEFQAHEAAARGDCWKTRERTDRLLTIDPEALRQLVIADPVVRACLAPATNRAP